MSQEQIELMEEAVALSRRTMETNTGGPFGAVVVKDGVVVGKGWNRVTSDNDPTAHAEVSAIRDACRNLDTYTLDGCEIYTSCEPCPMCLAAIMWARLDRIFYANTREDAAAIGFDDDMIYREIPLHPADRTVPAEQLDSPSARAVFGEWADKPDKIPY